MGYDTAYRAVHAVESTQVGRTSRQGRLQVSERRSPWLRALKHAVLVAAALGVAGAVLAGLDLFSNPDAVARAAGGIIVWVFFLVFGASAAFQKENRPVGIGFALIASVLTLFMISGWIYAALHRTEAPIQLTASEQSDLRPSQDGTRLCNPDLAFSLLSPGPSYKPAPALQMRMNAQLSKHHTFAWAYENPATRERLVIEATKGIGGREDMFRGLAQGMSEEIASQKRFVPRSQHLTWSREQGEFLLSLASPDGIALDFRCLASSSSSHAPPIMVCVQTISSATGKLRELRDGLTLKGC